jgi:hypothetical protein
LPPIGVLILLSGCGRSILVKTKEGAVMTGTPRKFPARRINHLRRSGVGFAALVAAAIVADAAPARAALTTFDIAGTVTTASVSEFVGATAQLPSGVAVGVPVSAALTFDTSALLSTFPLPGFDLAVTIAGNLWEARGGGIFVNIDPVAHTTNIQIDGIDFSSFPNIPPPNRVNTQTFELVIDSTAPGFLPDPQHLVGPLDLALTDSSTTGFLEASACFCFGPGPFPEARYDILFSLDSMTVANAVPEPASLLLFGPPAIGLWFALRRRPRRAGSFTG